MVDYVKENQHKKFEIAIRQYTVPQNNEGGYDLHILTTEGQKKLEISQMRVDRKDFKTTMSDYAFKPSSSGWRDRNDGTAEMCSTQNLAIVGYRPTDNDIIHYAETSPIIFYGKTEDGNGWAVTRSGSLYQLIGDPIPYHEFIDRVTKEQEKDKSEQRKESERNYNRYFKNYKKIHFI